MSVDFSGIQTKELQAWMQSVFNETVHYVVHNKVKVACAGIVLAGLLRYPYILIKRQLLNEVPGPIGLPLMGVGIDRILDEKRNGRFWINLGYNYGPLCQIMMGPGLVAYVVNHSELVKDLFINQKLIDREPMTLLKFNIFATKLNTVSLAQINGKDWLRRRHLAMSQLSNIPSNILLNITNNSLGMILFNKLDKMFINKQKEWFPRDDTNWFAFNTIYTYSVGASIDPNDKYWIEISNIFDKSLRWLVSSFLMTVFPFLIKTSFATPYIKLRERRDELIHELIDRRLKQLESESKKTESENYNSYVDAMLKFEKEGKISRDEIIADLTVLCVAGMDTTSSTIESGILLLAKYETIQLKMREIVLNLWQLHEKPFMNSYKEFDIRWLVGSSNENEINKKLAWQFNAFINEILRISSVAAVPPPHYTSNTNVTINVKKEYGTIDNKDHTFVIPKNTILIYNNEYIQKFSKFETKWKHNILGNDEINDTNCDKICLENWLEFDENGNIIKLKKAADLPFTEFGVGRRDCVGRYLAVSETKIFLANLLLNYKIEFSKSVLEKFGNNPSNVQITYKRGSTNMVFPALGVVLSKIV